MMTDPKDNNMEEKNLEDTEVTQESHDLSAEDELFQYGEETKQRNRKKLRSGMLRKFMPVFVLAGAALLLTGIYFTLRTLTPNDSTDAQVNKVKVLSLTASDVKSMTVKNPADTYTLYKKSGSVYKIEGKEDRDIDSDAIETAIGNTCVIESEKKIEVKNEKLSEYGLKEPQIEVNFVGRKENATLYVGNENASGDFYMCLKDDPENTETETAVYILADDTVEVFAKTHFYFYNTDISDYDANEDNQNISPIIIGGTKGTPVTMEMQQSSTDENNGSGTVDVSLSYIMTKPIRMPFSMTAMDSMLNLLTALNDVEAVADETDAGSLAKYGFDDPQYTLEFGNNTEMRTILFGKTEGDKIYCMKKDGTVIYLIAKSAVNCLSLSTADMCDVITYTRDIDTVKAMKVTGKQKTYDVQLLGKDEELQVYVNNKHVENSIFSEFYAGILGIEVKTEGTKPAGEPYMTVEITLDDDNDTKEYLRYYEVDNRYCYYELDGTGMFYVSHEAVDTLLSNIQKVYDNQEIVSAW